MSEEEIYCKTCKCSVDIPFDMEPTEYCDPCAQSKLIELESALSASEKRCKELEGALEWFFKSPYLHSHSKLENLYYTFHPDAEERFSEGKTPLEAIQTAMRSGCKEGKI